MPQSTCRSTCTLQTHVYTLYIALNIRNERTDVLRNDLFFSFSNNIIVVKTTPLKNTFSFYFHENKSTKFERVRLV